MGILLLSAGVVRADEIISFSYSQGGAIPQSEVRHITSGIPVGITMTTGQGDPWMKVTLSSNTTPADLTVSVQPAGMAVGDYQGFINITAGGTNTLAWFVRLSVKASGATGPTLTVSPVSLNLTVDEGDVVLPQRISVTSSGDPVDYDLSVSSSPSWLDVIADQIHSNGAVGGRAPGTFFALMTSKTLAPAVYTGKITITAAGASNSPIVVPVKLTVSRGQKNPGAATVTKLLPQFVAGGGWYTALYLGNNEATEATVITSLFSDEGGSLNVPGLGGSVKTVVPANGSAVIEAQDIGPLISGWAKVILPTGVFGYAVFRQSIPGMQPQEAVVPLSGTGLMKLRLLFDERCSDTAAAIVNTSDAAATITVTARDSAGNVIGSSIVPLKASGKTALRVRDLAELTRMQGQKGTIEVTSTQEGVAVLGLRFNGAALTSIPVTER